MAGIEDLIEVYRGEPLLNRKFPDLKGDTIAPKKVRGRWFSKSKDMAKYFAKEFPSIIKSVKIPESSFNIGKKLQKAAKLGLYSNPSEFLLPKNQMSKVKINLLQTVLANANALTPLAVKGLTYLASLPAQAVIMTLSPTKMGDGELRPEDLEQLNIDEANYKLENFAMLANKEKEGIETIDVGDM